MSHVCKLNHSGFAGNMESICAKCMWERSLQKNTLRYILHFMVMVTAKAFQLSK